MIIILAIKALELAGVLLDKLPVLENSDFFVYIKQWIDDSLHHCHKKHKAHMKKKKKNVNKPKGNKLVSLLLVANLIFSGVLFMKWHSDHLIVNGLVAEFIHDNPELFLNNKDYQNGYQNDNNDPNNQGGLNDKPEDGGPQPFDPFGDHNPTRSL